MAPSVYDAIKFCSWELLKIDRYTFYFTKKYKIYSLMVLIKHSSFWANTSIIDYVNNDFPNTKIMVWFVDDLAICHWTIC